MIVLAAVVAACSASSGAGSPDAAPILAHYDSLDDLAVGASVVVEGQVGPGPTFYGFPSDTVGGQFDAGYGYNVWELSEVQVLAGGLDETARLDASDAILVGTIATSPGASGYSSEDIESMSSDLDVGATIIAFLSPFTFPSGPRGYTLVGSDYGRFTVSESGEVLPDAPSGSLTQLSAQKADFLDQVAALQVHPNAGVERPADPYEQPTESIIPTTAPVE